METRGSPFSAYGPTTHSKVGRNVDPWQWKIIVLIIMYLAGIGPTPNKRFEWVYMSHLLSKSSTALAPVSSFLQLTGLFSHRFDSR